ncbi:MAG: YcaO-like family protein [Deltaproteobacteria bacterium]|nr:YcaO-like family protein [Deltaproteobacteria bacterium]
MSHKIVLKDAYKQYTHDQDKICSPLETVKRFKERLKKANLDILEKTVRIDNGRLDIPVFFSICGKDALKITGAKKQMGKGGTPQQAEASAVMELAERFSFFSFIKDENNFFIERYENISDRVLSFEEIAKSVHDPCEDPGALKKIFSMLPLKWTRAYNLTREEECLVPFDWFYTINEFNGASAGNCVEEALLQGICEVVERHVSSLISRNKISTPLIDINTVNDELSKEMIGKYQREGIKLYLSDFSLDTGIPTIGALAWDPKTFPDSSEIIWTAGTTPDPQKALNRALTEVAQLAGDFNSNSNYVASGLPKFNTLEEAGYVINIGQTVSINSLPDLSNNNIRTEIENCISALSKKNMEVIAINTMHMDLGIPAFYTIIPGAHFRERSAGTGIGMFSAKIIAENNDPGWAMAQLEKMDMILPGKYYIKFFMGICSLSLYDPEKALGYLEEALGLEPKEEDIVSILSYMAQCLKEMERYTDALIVLEKAEKIDRERTDIYNLMGFCFFRLKRHEEAIECFKKVLKLDPTSGIDYANIASNYRDMGDKEQAVAYYRMALEFDPSLDFARENLERLET